MGEVIGAHSFHSVSSSKDSATGDNKPNKAGGGGEKKTPTSGSGDKKRDDGPATVVLKVELHCEGCALKVKRSVKGFKGVESVSVDLASNKLTVFGKVDPVALRDRVETKTHKNVEIISPSQSKPKDAIGDAGGDKKPANTSGRVGGGGGGGDFKHQKPPAAAGDQKLKGPQVSTVMLKIRLHCEGCIKRIVKTIKKTEGVESVSVDAAKDLVIVKGRMDAKKLPIDLKDKLKRSVEVVSSKKDEGGENKEGGGGGGEVNKKKSGGGRGSKVGGGGDKDGVVEKMVPLATMNKMEYGYPITGPYGLEYGVEMAYAPQMFSDENPNACAIM